MAAREKIKAVGVDNTPAPSTNGNVLFYVSQITGESFKTDTELKEHYATFKKVEPNQAIVTLNYQTPILQPPGGSDGLRSTFSRNDDITIKSWFKEWLANKTENCKNFDVVNNSAMSEHGKWAYKPCIIAGAGPSLKKNAIQLKNRGGIGLVSVLHNFGYFNSIGVKADYWLNLDAGDIAVSEIGEGDPDVQEACRGFSEANRIAYLDKIDYWEKTKDQTLVTAIHGNPQLHKKWRGKIVWYDTALPGINERIPGEPLKKFNLLFQTGGNTLGACQYHAKAILGSSPIIFVGADFCFSYDKKFHPFNTHYDDKYDGLQVATDVYGNRVYTWPSYYGFKTWFEYIAMGGQAGAFGTYINCTEGGILGSYPEGNLIHIRQRSLSETLAEYNLHTKMPEMLAEKTGKMMVLY